MRISRGARVLAGCAASVLAVGVVLSAGPAGADSGRSRPGGDDHRHDRRHDRDTVFVAPRADSSSAAKTSDESDRSEGSDRSRHDDDSCDDAEFSSISAAVSAVDTGGTVVVCRGTYAEDVVVKKAMKLVGYHATIDAAGLENGIQVVASHVLVDGFTVHNANGEGILVGIDSLADMGLLPASGPVLSNVTVRHTVADNNDKGFNGTESGNCKYPGDCGGGIHLSVTTHSVVKDSEVNGNSDGILLTDDYGPSSYNVVEHNVVDDNLSECGIVLPSHASTR